MGRPRKISTAPVSPQGEPGAVEFIELEKAGETILVHPSCVKAHEGAGWSKPE